MPESDDENGLELDQDEIDAINDETFGGEVAGNDAELEDYAAQVADFSIYLLVFLNKQTNQNRKSFAIFEEYSVDKVERIT